MLISKEIRDGEIPAPAIWNYRIYLNGGNLIGDIAQNGDSATILYSTNLADNNWHLASFSRDAATNTLKLYVDGVSVVNPITDGLTGSITNEQEVWIGLSALDEGAYPFNGSIGSTFIYDRALTDIEVSNNYLATRQRFTVANITSAYLPSNGSTTVWTDSQGILNATMTGSPIYSSSLGYTFNGTTQYGRIANSPGINDFNNTNNYTVEVWFNPSTDQPSKTLATVLEKWKSTNQERYPYVFRYAETGTTLGISVYDGTNNPGVSVSGVNTNEWVQIVGVFNFTTRVLTAYKNGESGNTISLTSVGNVSNTSQVGIAHRIGSSPTFTPQHMFKGSIGLIRIYNTALSSSQILENFNTNRSTFGI